jgi:hypothetical protein
VSVISTMGMIHRPAVGVASRAAARRPAISRRRAEAVPASALRSPRPRTLGGPPPRIIGYFLFRAYLFDIAGQGLFLGRRWLRVR